jgi:hypothetical protein
VYNRVLKDPDAYILKKVARDYRQKFDSYIDIESINTQTIDALSVTLVERDVINPLQWASIKEFDYDKNYNFLYHQFEGMYYNSPELAMTVIVKGMILDYSFGDIFIWNKEDDIRQKYDIATTFGKSSKINYVTGDFTKLLDDVKPQIVYDWDVERVFKMNEDSSRNDTFFGVSAYGFNFEPGMDYKLKYDMSYHSNVAFFQVLNAEEKSRYKG